MKDKAARERMISLLSDADGLVSLHYLSEGRADHVFLDGHAPIEFELLEFCKLHPGAPVLLFRRTTDNYVRPVRRMIECFDHYAAQLNSPIIPFESEKGLQREMSLALQRYSSASDDVNTTQRVTVRYLGPDFIGLIGTIAEVIFADYKLNVDEVSHTSSGPHATVCLTCSPRHVPTAPASIDIKALRKALLRKVEAERLAVMGDSVSLRVSLQVFVDLDQILPDERQFYLEIRVIDAPGQMNAVCKELRTLGYNIDELQLKPTPQEYPRQRTMTMTISRRDHARISLREEIDSIEGSLQYLVGVRSLAIRILKDAAIAYDALEEKQA